MFTLFFIISLIASIWMINNKNGASGDGESMAFEFKDSLIILSFFILTFLLNFIFKNFMPKIYVLAAFVSILPDMILVSIVNANRERKIRTKQQLVQEVYESLADILGRVDPDDIDYDEVPFEYNWNDEKNSIDEITIDTRFDVKVNDNTITEATYSLNKQFPNYQWIGNENTQERELVFKGLPKPPDIAKYPGSDYHSFAYVPLGVGGQGEVGWYKTKDSRGVGFSNYIGEDNQQIETLKVATSPQMMVGGVTGGGKAIWIEQQVQIKK